MIKQGILITQKEIAPKIFKMKIQAEEIAKTAHCGQFINIYLKSKSTLLPRPMSISEIDGDNIYIVYAVVGEGTQEMSHYTNGEKIRLSSALGNGFTVQDDSAISVLVGGGIGVPPLIELAKNIKGQKIAVLGFKDTPILVNKLEHLGVKVFIATESGKVGFKGNVIELLKSEKIQGDYFYACGPKVMLHALTQYCNAINRPVQVSIDERMGCGYGVCIGCTIRLKASNENGYVLKKICTDGPVFLGSEVIWNDTIN